MATSHRPTLYELRLRAGCRSQAEMAAKLDVCQATYARVERGRGLPRPATLLALAGVLHISPELLWEMLRCGA